MKRFVMGGVFVNAALLIIGLTWIAPAAHGSESVQSVSTDPPAPAASTASTASTYTPQTKHFVVTTVPLLVHEQTGTYDYLAKDFSKSGILAGKEVWGFSPSSLTVYQGDRVDLTLVDPSGDPHTFSLSDLGFSLNVRAQAVARGSFTANKVGVFSFSCMVDEHNPYMWGQLVVLPDSAAPQE